MGRKKKDFTRKLTKIFQKSSSFSKAEFCRKWPGFNGRKNFEYFKIFIFITCKFLPHRDKTSMIQISLNGQDIITKLN